MEKDTRNHLCPDDYVKMIKKFVSTNVGYTKKDIFLYCISNSKYLDPGDEEQIRHIINISLDQFGKCIENRDGKYYTVSSLDDIIVFDDNDLNRLNLNMNEIDAISKIAGKSMYFINKQHTLYQTGCFLINLYDKIGGIYLCSNIKLQKLILLAVYEYYKMYNDIFIYDLDVYSDTDCGLMIDTSNTFFRSPITTFKETNDAPMENVSKDFLMESSKSNLMYFYEKDILDDIQVSNVLVDIFIKYGAYKASTLKELLEQFQQEDLFKNLFSSVCDCNKSGIENENQNSLKSNDKIQKQKRLELKRKLFSLINKDLKGND